LTRIAPALEDEASGATSVRRLRRFTAVNHEDSMADFTPHQQKIIKRYYENQDTIASQRLAELVGELYLATGKKRARVWTNLESAMKKLGVPQVRIDHLKKSDNAALVAELVKELDGK
jgi:hypothetical protein